MDRAFIIQHPDGREYELTDYARFLEEYEPQGFKIENPPRYDYWGGPMLDPKVEPEPKLETADETEAEGKKKGR